MTKRHAKPTAAALSERTYRHVLAFKRTLLNQMAHIRLDLATARREDREHIVKLIDHCARLLREKETLQRRLAAFEAPLTGNCEIPMATELKEKWPLPWPDNVVPPLAVLLCNCGASAYSKHAVIPWHHSNDCPAYRPEPPTMHNHPIV